MHAVLDVQHRQEGSGVDVADQPVQLEDVPAEPLFDRPRPRLDDGSELAEVAEDRNAPRGKGGGQSHLWRLGHARLVHQDAVEAALVDVGGDGGLREGGEHELGVGEQVPPGTGELLTDPPQLVGHPRQLAPGPALAGRRSTEQGVLPVHQLAAPALEGLQPGHQLRARPLQHGSFRHGEGLRLLEEGLPGAQRLARDLALSCAV